MQIEICDLLFNRNLFQTNHIKFHNLKLYDDYTIFYLKINESLYSIYLIEIHKSKSNISIIF